MHVCQVSTIEPSIQYPQYHDVSGTYLPSFQYLGFRSVVEYILQQANDITYRANKLSLTCLLPYLHHPRRKNHVTLLFAPDLCAPPPNVA